MPKMEKENWNGTNKEEQISKRDKNETGMGVNNNDEERKFVQQNSLHPVHVSHRCWRLTMWSYIGSRNGLHTSPNVYRENWKCTITFMAVQKENCTDSTNKQMSGRLWERSCMYTEQEREKELIDKRENALADFFLEV